MANAREPEYVVQQQRAQHDVTRALGIKARYGTDAGRIAVGKGGEAIGDQAAPKLLLPAGTWALWMP
ncbi:hypothetical protein D3C85_1909280 [compost metagenome]